ncbi:IucA/IucC family C-terminal-domain containing protein [Pseudonocardia sp. H11422]|uniref:IucA/IucC family C-terminal-domain containing protein n=1 Tax=Pseudonocardia sp. H11422 TaxID=2835866 RepID=UPI001BDC9E8D|nr:IucA/IucC family C-terminal-domain containing protein [Pseudonocardia sp. H11422]
MDVRAALADVGGFGPFFEVGTNPTEQADPTWRPLTDLYSDPVPLRDRIAHVRRVLDSDDRVAASITFQGMAARVLSAPLAVVVLHGVLPALTARTLHWRVSLTGPWPLWVDAPGGEALPDDLGAAADRLAALLVDEHLRPLAAAVRAQVGISERVLWGNAASSVAAGKRLIGTARPEAADRAARIAAGVLARDPFVAAGDRRAPVPPDVGWTFQRRSCCLYYRVREGGTCCDCVLNLRAGR